MKALALAVVVIVVLAFAAQKQQETAAVVVCGEVKGGMTMTSKGVEWAEEFGSWLHQLAETPVGPDTVKAVVKGVEKTLWYWLRTWFLSSRGLKLDPEILRLKEQAEAARAAAESQCTPCPTALPQDSSPLASIGAAPVTGSPEEVTRQVAARYWPADQVDMAVAIAGAESSYNPKAHNDYGIGVDGLWQINRQAHPDLVAGKNLQDPSVNAALAYRIWSDAGNSWTPWTTYTSGAYKRFLKPSAAAVLSAAVSSRSSSLTATPPAGSSSLPSDNSNSNGTSLGSSGGTSNSPVNPQNAGCQSGGMPEARIATWNTYVNNSTANVVAGMQAIAKQADIIGTQELSDSARKQAIKDALGPDWQASALDTSHPIWFNTKAFTLTSEQSTKIFTRGTPMEGPDQGDRYINVAVLRSVATGKTVTEVNFHQLPKIQKNGRLNAAWPKRIGQANDIFAAAMTAARVHLNQGAATMTCDCNFDGAIPGAAAAGLTSASQIFGKLDTRKDRDIDQVLYSAGTPTSERILSRHGSDHAPRIVTFPGDTNLADTSPEDGITPAQFNIPGQRTVEQAIQYMQAQQSSSAWGARCLAVVGRAYGHGSTQPVNGHYYAVGQWYAMPAQYKHTDGSTPPRGALVFWKTGSPAGHIAISAGGGWIWTSDPPGGRRGSVGKVRIEKLDAWGPRLGWSAPYFIGRTGGSAA